MIILSRATGGSNGNEWGKIANMPGNIEHISDTAFWVAHYRAMESARPDAHFRDPYAGVLAGSHGEEIVKRLRFAQSSAWAMIVRTIVFDELIFRCLRDGATTVVNLAAGLDTRPYRLDVPPSTEWVEVDLPDILDYKEEKLRKEKPVCELRRIKQDLSDADGRRRLFSEIGASGRQTVILSEGLLVYLTPENVASLAEDLRTQQNFRWWIIDIASPALVEMMMRWYSKQFKAAGIRMQFAPAEGPDFFKSYGWNPVEFRLSMEEGIRLNRTIPNAWLWRIFSVFTSKKRREEMSRNGMVLLAAV